MTTMKAYVLTPPAACLLLLAAVAALPPKPAAAAAGRADLAQVQSVFLLPMGNGLDQYLSNRITGEGVFQVVTDAQRADAILTDSVGMGFQRRMEEFFPPPPSALSEEEAEKRKKETAKDRMLREEAERESKREKAAPQSTWTRGRGNIFLVELKTRRVIWSVYERPKRTVPDELDKTAGRIVERLKKDIAGKPAVAAAGGR